MAQSVTKTTTNHDQIRQWAEERGGWPAQVAPTEQGGQKGMICIDFPGYTGQKLERISWDEWFRRFDESELALVYEATAAGGQRSNLNELVRREAAVARREGTEAGPGTVQGSGVRETGERTGRTTQPRTAGEEKRGGRRTRAKGRRQATRAAAAMTAGRAGRKGTRGARKPAKAKPTTRKVAAGGGRRGGRRSSKRSR